MKRSNSSDSADDSDVSAESSPSSKYIKNDALMQASKDGDWTEISKQISEGFQVDDLFLDEEIGEVTVLVLLSIHGHLECVQKLIEIGATRGHMKATVLAAKKGHIGCLRLLMRVSLCRAVGDNTFLCELVKTLEKQDFESIQEMLRGSGLKDVVGQWGSQLMNLLIVHGCSTICMQTLSDFEVDVNYECGESGFTPLKCSVYSRNVACTRFLLQNGVDFDIDSVIFCKDDDCLEELVRFLVKKQVMCYMDWVMNVDKTSSMSILLKYLDNIDSKDNCGMTLLMWACQKQSFPWAEFLLKTGADVNLRSNRGDTALSIACTKGYYAIVELLLKHKVDINSQFAAASPAGLFEVSKENMVRKLFDSGAQMGFCSLGENALVIACSKGHDKIVDLLLTHGANVFSVTPEGYNAIMTAAINNNVNCIKKLVEKSFAPINHRNKDMQTALMHACGLGYDEVTDVLLKNKGNPNVQDKKGKTPLMYAALNKKSLKCAQLLLEHKANVHLTNNKGRTALMVSCSHDNYEMLELMMQQGSAVNAQNDKGRTALMYATVNESIACVQKLLEHGVDLDLINEEGFTALMIACFEGNDKIVELLVKNKANVNLQNDAGKCAIMWAAVCGKYEAAVKIIPRLVESGADINMRTGDGDTALMYAMAKGYVEFVELMVENGADMNATNTDGRNAIMFAIGRRHMSCLQKLIDLGADLDVSDKDGSTVFSIAIEIDHAFKLLVDSGRLVDDNGLKSVHKNSITKQGEISFIFKNLLLAMERGFYDWNWCRKASSLQIVLHAAIVSGISQGWININGTNVSPLFYVYLASDFSSLTFLLSNLYFHSSDFRKISEYRFIADVDDESAADKIIVEKLFTKPLSLQTWSFLVVSEAISNAGPPDSRIDIVNKLPLPEGLKRALKFKTHVSCACLEELTEQEEKTIAGDLVFTGKLRQEIDLHSDDESHYCSHCVDGIEEEYD